MTWYASRSDGAGGVTCGCGCQPYPSIEAVIAGFPSAFPTDCTPTFQGPDNLWFEATSVDANGGYTLPQVPPSTSTSWSFTKSSAVMLDTFLDAACSDPDGSPNQIDFVINVFCNDTPNSEGKRYAMYIDYFRQTGGGFIYYRIDMTAEEYWFNLGEEVTIRDAGGTITFNLPA